MYTKSELFNSNVLKGVKNLMNSGAYLAGWLLGNRKIMVIEDSKLWQILRGGTASSVTLDAISYTYWKATRMLLSGMVFQSRPWCERERFSLLRSRELSREFVERVQVLFIFVFACWIVLLDVYIHGAYVLRPALKRSYVMTFIKKLFLAFKVFT